MSSLAAIPGTGPATSPIPVLRKAQRRGFNDLPTDRTLVMGIVNITHNSFSDGGQFPDADAAIKYALELVKQGADIIDIGGESTAPGAEPVSLEVERDRVIPVVEALVKLGVVVSVDTMHAEIAEEALALGPVIINDVSGIHATDKMIELIARSGAHYILMHNRGTAQTMDAMANYDDVVAEVVAELQHTRQRFLDAGVKTEQLIIDPGLGFAKKAKHNWALLSHLEQLAELGHPVLVAASRKRFLGRMLKKAGLPSEPRERDEATAAVSALAAAQGAWAVRVHEVEASVAAVQVARKWTGSN